MYITDLWIIWGNKSFPKFDDFVKNYIRNDGVRKLRGARVESGTRLCIVNTYGMQKDATKCLS